MNTKNLISKIKSTTNETLHQLRNNKALCAATMLLFSVTPVFCIDAGSIAAKLISILLGLCAASGVIFVICAVISLVSVIKDSTENNGGGNGVTKTIVFFILAALFLGLSAILTKMGLGSDVIKGWVNDGISF